MSDADASTPHELGSSSRKELGQLIQRIESLTEEKTQVGEKIKAEYAEAASSGYDKAAIKQLIKERAADTEKSVEHRSTVSIYRRALGSLANTPLGDWARGWMAQEARINKPVGSEESPQMADFMKGRKTKGASTNGDGEDART